MDDSLLTMKEILTRLRLSRPTIYRLVKQGKLNPVKIGKALRFKKSEVDALVERGTQNFERTGCRLTAGTQEAAASLPEGTLIAA